MLIGLRSLSFWKKTLHNRHQPNQHRKPIIIPTSLRPTVGSRLSSPVRPSVLLLRSSLRPSVRPSSVCLLDNWHEPCHHSETQPLEPLLHAACTTCGLCPFFQFVTQLWQKRWRRRWSLFPPSTAVMGNKESNESAAVKRQAEGGANPMYELLDLSGTTIWLKNKNDVSF